LSQEAIEVDAFTWTRIQRLITLPPWSGPDFFHKTGGVL
jgi:hypothetical protein